MLSQVAFDAGYYAGTVNGFLGADSALTAAHTYANGFDGVDTPEQRIARIFHFGRGWQAALCVDLARAGVVL